MLGLLEFPTQKCLAGLTRSPGKEEEEDQIGGGNGGGDTFSVHGNGNQVDNKAFHAVQKSFVQVQSILNQNRLLINEINQNHETMIPDNLGRNVGLIRELNNNIRRVVDLYADLSLSLSFAGPTEASSGGDSGGKLGHKRVRHVNES